MPSRAPSSSTRGSSGGAAGSTNSAGKKRSSSSVAGGASSSSYMGNTFGSSLRSKMTNSQIAEQHSIATPTAQPVIRRSSRGASSHPTTTASSSIAGSPSSPLGSSSRPMIGLHQAGNNSLHQQQQQPSPPSLRRSGSVPRQPAAVSGVRHSAPLMASSAPLSAGGGGAYTHTGGGGGGGGPLTDGPSSSSAVDSLLISRVSSSSLRGDLLNGSPRGYPASAQQGGGGGASGRPRTPSRGASSPTPAQQSNQRQPHQHPSSSSSSPSVYYNNSINDTAAALQRGHSQRAGGGGGGGGGVAPSGGELGRLGSSLSARGRIEGALRTARGLSEDNSHNDYDDSVAGGGGGAGPHHYDGDSQQHHHSAAEMYSLSPRHNSRGDEGPDLALRGIASVESDGGDSSSGTSSDGVGDGDATPTSKRVRKTKKKAAPKQQRRSSSKAIGSGYSGGNGGGGGGSTVPSAAVIGQSVLRGSATTPTIKTTSARGGGGSAREALAGSPPPSSTSTGGGKKRSISAGVSSPRNKPTMAAPPLTGASKANSSYHASLAPASSMPPSASARGVGGGIRTPRSGAGVTSDAGPSSPTELRSASSSASITRLHSPTPPQGTGGETSLHYPFTGGGGGASSPLSASLRYKTGAISRHASSPNLTSGSSPAISSHQQQPHSSSAAAAGVVGGGGGSSSSHNITINHSNDLLPPTTMTLHQRPRAHSHNTSSGAMSGTYSDADDLLSSHPNHHTITADAAAMMGSGMSALPPGAANLPQAVPRPFVPTHFGGFPRNCEAPREALRRMAALRSSPTDDAAEQQSGSSSSHRPPSDYGPRGSSVPQHVRNVVNYCRAHVPLLNYFQLVEVLIPLQQCDASAAAGEKEGDHGGGAYTYAYHWAPRNDMLARGLQMFETMGYRNTLFEHAFDQLSCSAARAIASAGGAAQTTPAEVLSCCGTVLDLLSPDAPTPSLFGNRAQLAATVATVPLGTRRMYQRQRDVAAADRETSKGGGAINGKREFHAVSSHSSFEASSSAASPFQSCDVAPFLAHTEGNRWLSEQEYVIAALLFSIAGATGPAAERGVGVSFHRQQRHNQQQKAGPQPNAASAHQQEHLTADSAFLPFTSPRFADCAFDSFLLHDAGFDGTSGEALCAAVDALLLGPSNCGAASSASPSPPLSVEERTDLMYRLLASHPVVYVALKSIPSACTPTHDAGSNHPHGAGLGAANAAIAADRFAKSEGAVSFLEAWTRQANNMFTATCARHNHVVRSGGGDGAGNNADYQGAAAAGGGSNPLNFQSAQPAPFDVLPLDATLRRWQALFDVKCSPDAARWVIGGALPHAEAAVGAGADSPMVVTSDVECGSMAPRVDRYDPLPTPLNPRPSPTVLFRGCGDTTDEDCKKVWFRFVLKGSPAARYGATASFRAMNMAAHGRLYRSGMRPVCKFGGAMYAVTGRMKRTAQWHLVSSCNFVPVRNDEEAEISFTVNLPPAGGGASVGPSSAASHHVFRCSSCPTAGGLGHPCLVCSIKTWLLTGVHSSAMGGSSTLLIAPALQPTVHISFCEPYSYGSLLSHVALWHSVVKRSPSNIKFEERVLCNSVDGRKLHLLIITSLSDRSARQETVASMQGGGGGGGAGRSASAGRYRKTGAGSSSGSANPNVNLQSGAAGWTQLIEMLGFYSFGTMPPTMVGDFSGGKKVVLLSGRIHPSEVTGSYALHGLVQFLLSPDPRAAQLRDNFIFFVVPMLNPDGVSRGHNRQDQYGDNLNRCYNNPSPETQPTVLALKNVFDFLHQHYRERFLMYLDFHSHASQLLGFAFGNCLAPQLQPWNMLFPRLIDAHSNGLFSTSGSKFAKNHMASKDGTSRVLFGQSLMHSYTMELTHFAHLQWSPSQGVVGGGVSATANTTTGAITFAVPPPPPHEEWDTYTKSSYLLDEDSVSHSHIQPWFVILRQSAEVGRACATALLDYCAIGVPPPSLSSASSATGGGKKSSTPPPQSVVSTLGRPSEAVQRAGGLDKLVREARQQALKLLQPSSGARGGDGKGKGSASSNATATTNSTTGKPTWNGF